MHRFFKPIATSLLALFFTQACILAQGLSGSEWKETRQLTILSEEEKNYGLYYILFSVKYEYAYDPYDKSLICFVTNHNIIRVNNDEALSKTNRVFIPMQNTLELTDLKARAITKNNRIIDFDKINLKELESDEEGYKILAIEGAEVGGEIEFYYTRKIKGLKFLSNTFQLGYPVKSYYYSLKCPENLEYDFEIYNWNGKVIQTDTIDQFNSYGFTAENIPAIYEEEFSAHVNYSARIETKLAYNTTSGNARLNTWGDAGKVIYDNVYQLSTDEQKSLNKFMKDMNFAGDPIVAFKKAEHYIKSTIVFEKQAGDAGEKIDLILKNKYASSLGLIRTLAAILDYLKVEHEIVVTSNRMEKAFDPGFDSWNYLEEYLIYLPASNEFLCPRTTHLRTGIIPSGYYGTYGLFVRRELIQDFIYPVAHIAYIPEAPYSANCDNMDISVDFQNNQENNKLIVTRSFTGYGATYYKDGLKSLNNEDKKQMLEEIIKYLSTSAEIQKIDVVHGGLDFDTWNSPLIVSGTFSTKQYIELAGETVLFKVGELIGPQSELYMDHNRQLPVDNSFNRGYKRKIKVQIPGGYSIQNPDDLIIKEQVFNDQKKLIYNFDSSYKLSGQSLEIEIDEFYDQLKFPLEQFESFRKVINSAADFNKIVLVLTQ
jgi:hypothetical protein